MPIWREAEERGPASLTAARRPQGNPCPQYYFRKCLIYLIIGEGRHAVSMFLRTNLIRIVSDVGANKKAAGSPRRPTGRAQSFGVALTAEMNLAPGQVEHAWSLPRKRKKDGAYPFARLFSHALWLHIHRWFSGPNGSVGSFGTAGGLANETISGCGLAVYHGGNSRAGGPSASSSPHSASATTSSSSRCAGP
jgi:hypothetical protein